MTDIISSFLFRALYFQSCAIQFHIIIKTLLSLTLQMSLDTGLYLIDKTVVVVPLSTTDVATLPYLIFLDRANLQRLIWLIHFHCKKSALFDPPKAIMIAIVLSLQRGIIYRSNEW